jgi:hypothetical protein
MAGIAKLIAAAAQRSIPTSSDQTGMDDGGGVPPIPWTSIRALQE